MNERTWRQQRQSVNDYIAFAIKRDTERSHDFAILLAGMKETDPESGPASRVENAQAKDRQWWLKLKRKLNGNEKRFANALIAPKVVEGLKTPVLRDGTWEAAGMKKGTVEKIHAVLEEWSNDTDQPFNVCVARRGVIFFHRAYGSRNGKPITTDTKHVVFSITKALSGSLLMMFVDQGFIRLDEAFAEEARVPRVGGLQRLTERKAQRPAEDAPQRQVSCEHILLRQRGVHYAAGQRAP